VHVNGIFGNKDWAFGVLQTGDRFIEDLGGFGGFAAAEVAFVVQANSEDLRWLTRREKADVGGIERSAGEMDGVEEAAAEFVDSGVA
jgi:hypothetical protein